MFSIGLDKQNPYTDGASLAAAKDKVAMLWVAIGEKDSLMPDYLRLEKLLRSERIRHVSKITPGGHTWSNWRHYLRDFLPLLFTR